MRVNTDFTNIIGKDHEEKWVALSQDRRAVVDCAENLVDLRSKLGAKKSDVVYMRVLPSDREFAFARAWRE